MRIGVVSDTHNHLANVRRIVSLFNEAGVERVVHTGDITQPKTLELFAALECPLYGVYGNNDVGEQGRLEQTAAAHDFHFVEPPLRMVWNGRRILVVHDPLDLDGLMGEDDTVVLHGHTHRQRIERDAGRLIFNPGECAGHVPGLNRVGVLDLALLEPELLAF